MRFASHYQRTINRCVFEKRHRTKVLKGGVMKLENLLAWITRTSWAWGLVFFACIASAQAQSITPRVCVETNQQNGATTLAVGASAGATQIIVTSDVPLFATLTINPGGTNQETVPYVKPDGS